MPRPTLCMIVRDEERFLGACLESARPFVDRIVVVDTGSRDATPAIAAGYGAEVLRRPWDDDFAAARNAGLDLVREGHVLVLDADERLAPGAGSRIEAACRDADFGVALLPLHNADAPDVPVEEVLDGRRRLGLPVHLPRLFPAHPALRYRGRVHEVLVPDLRWLAREVGLGARWLEAPLVHVGDSSAVRAERGKGTRNTRLLERALAEAPDDVELAGQLAGEHYQAERFDDAEAVARDAWTRLLAGERSGERRPSPTRLGGVLGLCLLRRGADRELLEVATRSLDRCETPHPNLLYLQGVALDRLGRTAEAEGILRRAVDGAGLRLCTPAFHGLGDRARLRLADGLYRRGRLRGALTALRSVRGTAAVGATLLRAEVLLAAGRPEEALRWLTVLRRLETPPPDLAALTSAALDALGVEDPDAGERARRAEGWIEPRRRELVDVPGAPGVPGDVGRGGR